MRRSARSSSAGARHPGAQHWRSPSTARSGAVGRSARAAAQDRRAMTIHLTAAGRTVKRAQKIAMTMEEQRRWRQACRSSALPVDCWPRSVDARRAERRFSPRPRVAPPLAPVFLRWSSTAMLLPCTVLEKPHCGEAELLQRGVPRFRRCGASASSLSPAGRTWWMRPSTTILPGFRKRRRAEVARAVVVVFHEVGVEVHLRQQRLGHRLVVARWPRRCSLSCRGTGAWPAACRLACAQPPC